MKSEHTPIPDAELESDWLVLPRGRMKDEIKETRRLLRALHSSGMHYGVDPDLVEEIVRYLSAAEGKEQP